MYVFQGIHRGNGTLVRRDTVPLVPLGTLLTLSTLFIVLLLFVLPYMYTCILLFDCDYPGS